MIMSNKDIEEYHNIGLDTATKVFNKFKDGTLPWLELDIDFKPFIDSQELNSVDPYYVPHRSDEYGNKGWSSCCLHGLGMDLTEVAGQYGYKDELNAPYDWTALTENAPLATKFWKQFPAERYSRIRFMKLEAHGKIEWHDDHPGHELPNDLCNYLLSLIHISDHTRPSIIAYGVLWV